MSDSEPSGSRHTGKASAAVAKAYIQEMLELNPVWQSPQIIRRRSELWSGVAVEGSRAKATSTVTSPTARSVATTENVPVAEVAGQDPLQQQRVRQRCKRCLDRLQSEFYTLPEDKLDAYLRYLENSRLPEFAEPADRLRRVADQRPALLEIATTNSDRAFSDALLSSLVSPVATAEQLREQYIERIARERRVKRACANIARIIQRHPQIHELEPDWFDVLLDRKNRHAWSRHYSPTGLVRRFVGNRIVQVVTLTIVIVIVIAGATDDANRNSRTRNRASGATGRSPSPTSPKVSTAPGGTSATPSPRAATANDPFAESAGPPMEAKEIPGMQREFERLRPTAPFGWREPPKIIQPPTIDKDSFFVPPQPPPFPRIGDGF